MTQYTTEDFARWGRQGGNLHKKTKDKDYFSQIASLRKNPGRKKKLGYRITGVTRPGQGTVVPSNKPYNESDYKTIDLAKKK